jgi:hypothetical protein
MKFTRTQPLEIGQQKDELTNLEIVRANIRWWAMGVVTLILLWRAIANADFFLFLVATGFFILLLNELYGKG